MTDQDTEIEGKMPDGLEGKERSEEKFRSLGIPVTPPTFIST
jgi:hypothetical protein